MRWLLFLLFVSKLLTCTSVPFWAISPPPGAGYPVPSLAPQPLVGHRLGAGGLRGSGGLQLAEAHCWLQLVRQGSEDLVELLVALSLAALSPTAAPEQSQLELSAEDFQQLRSALETCKRESQFPGMGSPAPVGCSILVLELHTGNVAEGKGFAVPTAYPAASPQHWCGRAHHGGPPSVLPPGGP